MWVFRISVPYAQKDPRFLFEERREFWSLVPTTDSSTLRQDLWLIFREFAAESEVELAHSIPESADYTAASVIVGRLPLSDMFNILNPLESADTNWLTIAVGLRERTAMLSMK